MMEQDPKIEIVVSTEESAGETQPMWSRPIRLPMCIVIWTFGIVVPIICHLITIEDPPQTPEWQSGRLSDKLGFVLSGKCGWPMYPLLGFPIFCLGMVLVNERNAKKRWVRFGLFTGVPVTAWYLFAFGQGTEGIIPLLVSATFCLLVVYGLIWGFQFLCKKFNDEEVKSVVRGISVILVILLLIAIVATHGFVFFVPIIFALYLSTPFAFLIYLLMSIRLLKQYPLDRFSIAELMAGITWLGALLGALRATITLSIEEYSKLPLEPPEGCYIATAAAKGYPAIVGSQKLPAAAGEPVWVNSQLTTFKIAELALRSVWPRAHRALRFFYNRIGPCLAARLGTPVAATLAYMTLKPAEWTCRFLLRIVLGRKALGRASKLYLDRANASCQPFGR